MYSQAGASPIAIQKNDAIPIARSIFKGASLQRILESWAKKVKKGILIPEWYITPAEAKRRISQTTIIPCASAPERIKDLLTNPLKNGTAEIEAAPITQKTAV